MFTEQQHPQAKKDQVIVDRLLKSPPDAPHLLELARLRIRYKNFPGAMSLQRGLDRTLQQWNLSEDELFAKTREIYANRDNQTIKATEAEDWS